MSLSIFIYLFDVDIIFNDLYFMTSYDLREIVTAIVALIICICFFFFFFCVNRIIIIITLKVVKT